MTGSRLTHEVEPLPSHETSVRELFFVSDDRKFYS